MKLSITLLSALLLTACNRVLSANEQGEIKAPFDEWYFTFTTPRALPAQVTLVKMLDINGYARIFRTIDQPQGSSVGSWDQYAGMGPSPFNQAPSPPTIMIFCWDSIIDKKVYETTLLFAPETWHKMLSTEKSNYSPKEIYYFQYMVIGLAPEGKVRVWLNNNGRPNLEQTKTEIKTRSGKDLNMCKGVTGSDFSKGYSNTTKNFIKGKTYPYGNW
ncbi:DUF2931 domain-containing protein [Cronobacter sakazakii]|uniref:DUF2931 family protein n=6 Tax=Cronobacter sakazakii TaxID=28141 RepID=A7MRE6_CROS8|nr:MULTISPECIES: DUF2931 family protein [Cronobacter]ABU79700.1 hypothetical protein ESA_pESA3p05503 [Cronobacter sakazakii ATCC BAA-894]ASR82225.1 Hypothetical protein [Cronobacter sakazakii]AXX04736.1 DUF2931 domain-containing protein [Cronobacter sakazakii]EGT5667162.1 DUF2931 family protein [Cronobacter sakazakii]EGZ6860210.1 DUF2931 family protein [Cronobacter sakazakii]